MPNGEMLCITKTVSTSLSSLLDYLSLLLNQTTSEAQLFLAFRVDWATDDRNYVSTLVVV
jgi:hypothetical protein